MINLVGTEVGDVGIANSFLDYYRTYVVDTTAPYDFDYSCFLTPAPRVVPRWQSLSFPFTLESWIALVCMVGVMTLLIPLFAKIVHGEDDAKFTSPEVSFLYTVAMISNESVPQPKKSLRPFMAPLMLMGFVTAIFYSSNLTAYLMTKTFEQPIQSMRQLAESGLPVSAFGNVFDKNLLASLDPYQRQLGRRYTAISAGFDPYFKQTSKGLMAVISNRQHLEFVKQVYFTNNLGESSVRIQEECISTYSIVILIPKNSVLKKTLDKAIIRILSGGLTLKFFRDSLRIGDLEDAEGDHAPGQEPPEEATQSGDNNSKQVITTEHLQGAFFILLIGNFLALLVCVAECSIHAIKTTS
ncbi:ionotropic receptor 21a-like [Oratosquilla oratoria]|uniref:ionotropic receptor 21a-like n=1 Tax=Oratosquilla oratoria TaxID=337810 RepID=UPI003F75DA99